MFDGKPYGFGRLDEPDVQPGHRHLEWLRLTAREMGEDYASIFQKLSGSTGKIQESGHEIEAAWESFLSNWLPPSYEVSTRKYIVGEVDAEADVFETDIVVFRPSYPKILRKKTHVLASGVAAAFSVKSTLRPSSIEEATRRCAQLQRSLAHREGTMRKELVRPFPYGLLANSHDWKLPGSNPAENVTKELFRRDIEFAAHPRESVDFVCVADLGVWSKHTHFSPGFPIQHETPSFATPEELAEFKEFQTYIENDRLLTTHTHTPSEDGGQVFAVFLTALYARLAMSDPSIEELAKGFGHMGGAGYGSGLQRNWTPSSVLTPSLLEPSAISNLGWSNAENGRMFGDTTPW